MKMKHIHIIMIAAAAGMMTLSACHDHTADSHDHEGEQAAAEHGAESSTGEIVLSPERAREAGVVTRTIVPGEFTSAIRTSGVLSPSGKGAATISSRISGILSWEGSTPVPGQAVSRDGLLASVSSAGTGEGDAVTRAAITYEAAKKEYERAKALLEDRIISQKEFTGIEADYLTARSAYQGTGEGSVDGKVGVASPLDGYIVSVLKAEGDYVTAGEAIATVSASSRLRLTADLPEKYALQRTAVSGVNFSLPYLDSLVSLKGAEGHPISSGQAVSASSPYIPVTFEFSNTLGLIPGSYARVWLLTDTRDGVISVPESALTEEQGEYFVYVRLDEECYKKVPVETGGRNGSEVEITSGLKGGEDVVVEGAYQVRLSAASVIPGHTHNH